MSPCNRKFPSCVLAALLSSAACGSSDPIGLPEGGPPLPVDGKFAVTAEGGGAPEGAVVSVDVFWRPDGKVDVTFDDGAAAFLPGPEVLKGVELKLGNAVLNEGKVEIVEGGEKHQVRLEGTIAPDLFEVELTDTPPGGEPVTVRLYGGARPFGDSAALDGEYLAFRQVSPVFCPGETPVTPASGRNVVIDVLPTYDGFRVVIDGRLEAILPEGDPVAWSGTFADRWNPGGAGYAAVVSGTLLADNLALTVDLAAESYGAGCVSRAAFTGGKRLPDPAVIDGDYRAEYEWTDACRDAEGRFASPLALLQQDGGMIDFFEYGGAWMQFSMTPGQPFEGDFIDIFGSGARISYDGLIDPPDLSYTAVYTYPYAEPCDLTLHVTAYKRYFFPEG